MLGGAFRQDGRNVAKEGLRSFGGFGKRGGEKRLSLKKRMRRVSFREKKDAGPRVGGGNSQRRFQHKDASALSNGFYQTAVRGDLYYVKLSGTKSRLKKEEAFKKRSGLTSKERHTRCVEKKIQYN